MSITKDLNEHKHEHPHEHDQAHDCSDHCHSHEHTHTHEHIHTHEHNHTHEHAHSHDHAHTHEHAHSHGDHSHEHGGTEEDKEVFALISYMLSHNRHHAQELRELADRLVASGRKEAAAVLSEAVLCFEKGNDGLEKTIGLLK